MTLDWYFKLAEELVSREPFHTGEVHAQDTSADPQSATYELMDVRIKMDVPDDLERWMDDVKPNLPWAEEHFGERVGGVPFNPAPSHVRWPFARKDNDAHTKAGGKFSHTYPERFWPTYAGHAGENFHTPNQGIRFMYGDLMDLIQILVKNPLSRQAYLPVWFPEDLTAAVSGERVPCTIGYHFMYRDGRLHCWYTMRSCDFVRYLRDDIYMAGRLMMWICDAANREIDKEPGRMGEYGMFVPGILHLTISSLHAFVGDRWFLNKMVADANAVRDIR